IPLWLIGLFTLERTIALRRTTTLFHKAIVTIRHQLLKDHITEDNKPVLWIHDDKPRYFYKGFNYLSALLVMALTALVFAIFIGVLIWELGGKDNLLLTLALSFLAGILHGFGQERRY